MTDAHSLGASHLGTARYDCACSRRELPSEGRMMAQEDHRLGAQGVSYDMVRESLPPGHGPEFPAAETGARSIAENTAPGTSIGAPVGGRDEEGDVLTYTPRGADAALFDVDRTSGQHLTKARLDYESRNSYSVMLTVFDPTNASDAITVVVNITNMEKEGTITLSTPQPFAGDELLAYLDDPDGGVGDVTWQ